MIKLIDLLFEAKFGDIEVVPTKGTQRGTSEPGARSFNINIGNTDVINKMKHTPMGKAGSATSFSYEGPGGQTYTEFKWDANTSQWDVWENMNYVALTPPPNNEVHWYHGKVPGGIFTDKSGKLLPGATGTPLPDLTIDKFGYKVYKALLLDPNVKFISSNKSSTPAVKNSVYKNLMRDSDFIWMTAGGTEGGLDYNNIVVINPNYANVSGIEQEFKSKYRNKGPIYYSPNFPHRNK
jgi:hypothetical protein